jgi:chorismate mutase
MYIRGIRGAITVEEDKPEEILAATSELLTAILGANPDLSPKDIASVLFTLSPDLVTAYPAKAARQLGWVNVPLMCAQEISAPGSLRRCVRVLIHWNTELTQSQIMHVYLKGAQALRPDLSDKAGGNQVPPDKQ